MKLVCTQENFKKAIYSTERVVGKQITLPILENILLETEGGMLKIAATNLEIGVFLKIGAKIEEEGRITIPAKLLGNFVGNLPNESTISLEVSDQVLNISSGKYKAKIKGLGANDFPIIPEMEGGFTFSLSALEMKEALPKLISSVSLDGSRPELSGINMSFFEQEIHLAATDSFRLAEYVCPLKREDGAAYDNFRDKKASVIIPSTTMAEVLRVISSETEEVKISIEESQIFFQVDNVRIVSRLINGKYPEYKQIIPQNFSTKAIMEKDEAARAVKIAGIFAGNKSGEIKLVVKQVTGEVLIESTAEEVGSNIAELSAQVEGGGLEMVFNPRYIADGLAAISSPKFAFLANSSASPAVLKMADQDGKPDERFTYIIMPIKN